MSADVAVTLDAAVEIGHLVMDLVRKLSGADPLPEHIDAAATLEEIVVRAAQAYYAHTGEPLDESVIQPEDPI